MLTHLDISNYLLIRDLALDIPAGLVVLTGETGAGKSMILGAIDVLMGKPFPKDPIRNGGTRAVIEGTFKLTNSDAVRKTAGDDYFEDHDGVILLRREMAQGGKTRSFLNDQPIPQSRLAALREHLLDSHAQRENQSLYRPEKQLEFLDVFAGAVPKVQSFRELHRKRSELNRAMIELRERYTAHMREQSLLTYQLEEIERLGLQKGEEEIIEARLSKLENSEKLREQSHILQQLMIENDDAISVRLGQARTIATDLSKTDHDLETFASELKSVESQLKDLGNQIRDYCESVEMDQEELETLRERRGVLWDLKRKHGMSLDQIIARADELKHLLEEGEQLQARLQSAQAEIETVDKQLIASGTELSKIRKSAASQLSPKIEERLRPLGFAKVAFHVVVESDSPVQPETVARNGADRVHFRFSANVGTEPAELADAASGGEASRVLLAIKSVLADKIRYPLMIYDEIDLGISGQIAERVGSELASMGKRHQLIVISHLPQIASKADHHLLIEKTVSGQTTETSARFLKESERVTAVAALLAGRTITKHSLASADELLNQRKQDRENTIG